MFTTAVCVRGDNIAHLGYCEIAAGCGCCTGALASHTRAESSPNSAEKGKCPGETTLMCQGMKPNRASFKPPVLQLSVKYFSMLEYFLLLDVMSYVLRNV